MFVTDFQQFGDSRQLTLFCIDFESQSSDNELQEGSEMTIQLEISPEAEAWLAAEAASQSMDIPTYAACLIEKARPPVASGSQSPIAPPQRHRPDGNKSLAQLFAESP